MRRLLLTTASVIALGLGGIGVASAHGTLHKNAGISGSTTPTKEMSQQRTTRMKHRTAMRSHRTGTNMARSEIRQVQEQLRADNLYKGRIDGLFGTKTKTALKEFQQQNNLPATARLDRKTMNDLLASGATGQGTSMPPKSHRTTTTKQLRPNQNTKMNTGTGGQGSSLPPKQGQGKNMNSNAAGQGSSLPPQGSQAPNQAGTSQPTNNANQKKY